METQYPNHEDALSFIISNLNNPQNNEYSHYGYGVYLPSLMRGYLNQEMNLDHHEGERHLRQISPPFYAAAWELCRMGVLRPGVIRYGEQVTSDGSGGNGYSLTPYGESWLKEYGDDEFIPTEPGRFGEMLSPFRSIFGNAYYSRAQEAIKCLRAHAYLACCTMCGAAMESIMLQIAIEKTQDEEMVLKEYRSARGRSKIENIILGQASRSLKSGFTGYNEIVKYWRDDAAHGDATTISNTEAFTALMILIKFSNFINDKWDELIS